MDADDPEKRIAELQHQPGKQVRGEGLPPAQPPQPTDAAPETDSGRKTPAPIGIWTWIAIAFVVLNLGGPALYWFCIGALPAYQYWVGTPATATIDHCVSDTGGETCYGRWSVGGVSQIGPIHGYYGGHDGIGSRVDVRVHGGMAYAPSEAIHSYVTVFCGGYVIVFGVVVLWCVWRKRKTGSWPWSGRRFKFSGLSGPPNRA